MPRDLVKEASSQAKNLQVDEIEKISAAWRKFDVDGNGTVTTGEVDALLDTLNIKIPQSEQDKIIKLLDRNGNGTIEFIEFVLQYEKGAFKNIA